MLFRNFMHCSCVARRGRRAKLKQWSRRAADTLLQILQIPTRLNVPIDSVLDEVSDLKSEHSSPRY